MSSGTNFGLNDDYDYFELYLDSYDALTSNDSAFPYTDYPLFQLASPVASLAAFKVLEVQIPFSFDVFNASNNTFLLTDDIVTNATVTIAVGNYNATTLATQLKTSLELASPTRTYTVTFAGQNSTPNTGKFRISNNAVGSGTFTLTFGDSADQGLTNPRLFLGLNAGANISNNSHVLTAPNAASITGANYLFLNSRTIGTQINAILPAGARSLGDGTRGPQLCKIPITVQPGGVIYWMDPGKLVNVNHRSAKMVLDAEFGVTNPV